MARKGMLPTPTTLDYVDRNWESQKNRNSLGISEMARFGMLPTPAAVDWKQTTLAESQRNRSTLPGLMVKTFLPMPDKITDSQKNSQLSPQFVMEMMGFPTNWTLLPFSKK